MIDLYLREINQGISEKTIKQNNNYYARLKSNMPDKKSINNYSKKDFVVLLTKMNATTKGSFYQSKTMIRNYLLWLLEKGEIKPRQLEVFNEVSFGDIDYTAFCSTHYFRNFDDLYKSLEESIWIYNGKEDETDEFNNLRCAMYLAWYGFTNEEIRGFLKSYINHTDNVIYKGKEQMPIRVDEKCHKLLLKHAEAEEYIAKRIGHSSGNDSVKFVYKPSEYLLRSYRSEQYTESSFAFLTNGVNKISDETNRLFLYKKVFLSGIFHRACLDEIEHGELLKNDYDRLARLFMPNLTELPKTFSISQKTTLAHKRLAEYKVYKKVFYGF